MIKFRPTAKFDKPAVLILLDKDQFKRKSFAHLHHATLKKALLLLSQTRQFHANDKEIFPLALGKQLVLLAGVGKSKELTPTSLRIVVRNAILSSFLKAVKDIEIIPHAQKDLVITAIIEGFQIGTYSWNKYRTTPKDTGQDKIIEKKIIHLVTTGKKIYEETATICEGVTLTRDLVNENADVVTAAYFEKTIRNLIKGKRNVSLTILNKKELKAKGLNLHLAVNQGSEKEPKLIIVQYRGSLKKGNSTAVIGKGITFDTGGLNLKPSGHIETMRCDMSGAAAVVGTLKNTLALKLKKNIIFVCALAENAIGSESYKPGDVIKGYSGKTVEIGNTDAEGRLVLADALSYIGKNYKPNRMIDMATLTGACVVALGHDYTGLISTQDTLTRQLLGAAQKTDDRAWQLPSYPEIKDYVKSQIADIRNISVQRGAGGTITAAEFLRQFTNDIPWAHLDIAGTAFAENQGRMYYGHGATGAGVRLMTEYLRNV